MQSSQNVRIALLFPGRLIAAATRLIERPRDTLPSIYLQSDSNDLFIDRQNPRLFHRLSLSADEDGAASTTVYSGTVHSGLLRRVQAAMLRACRTGARRRVGRGPTLRWVTTETGADSNQRPELAYRGSSDINASTTHRSPIAGSRLRLCFLVTAACRCPERD